MARSSPKISVPVDVDKDVAPLPELGDVGDKLAEQPTAVAAYKKYMFD